MVNKRIIVQVSVNNNQILVETHLTFYPRSGVESVPQNAKLHYNYANLQKDNGNIGLAAHHYKLALRYF